MKHRLFLGLSFFLTSLAFLTLHLVVVGTTSTATAQHRQAISVSVPPFSNRAADVAEQFPVGEQHPKLKPHHEIEKTPAKRAQLCKKLELRRAELRTQSEEKQKHAMADSASASGK